MQMIDPTISSSSSKLFASRLFALVCISRRLEGNKSKKETDENESFSDGPIAGEGKKKMEKRREKVVCGKNKGGSSGSSLSAQSRAFPPPSSSRAHSSTERRFSSRRYIVE